MQLPRPRRSDRSLTEMLAELPHSQDPSVVRTQDTCRPSNQVVAERTDVLAIRGNAYPHLERNANTAIGIRSACQAAKDSEPEFRREVETVHPSQ